MSVSFFFLLYLSLYLSLLSLPFLSLLSFLLLFLITPSPLLIPFILLYPFSSSFSFILPPFPGSLYFASSLHIYSFSFPFIRFLIFFFIFPFYPSSVSFSYIPPAGFLNLFFLLLFPPLLSFFIYLRVLGKEWSRINCNCINKELYEEIASKTSQQQKNIYLYVIPQSLCKVT